MTKLWQKEASNSDIQKIIELFTVGSDKVWDVYLAKSDVIGSLAHAKMLHNIDLLTVSELADLEEGLLQILKSIEQGTFRIEDGVEDVHSQIEILLTQNKGEVGKKIHSGRSRNDQSLVAIKLFVREELKNIAKKTDVVFNKLIELSGTHQNTLIPGYTHLQLAMPSSFGLWFGAYAESLSDDIELLIAAYNVANKNPLGSGAGYGSSFPLNRQMTTDLLGFDTLNYNVVYAQMTRGKTEKISAIALAAIGATLSRFSSDVCLYMNQNFDFITFPNEFTTGSSIMPHKKNPDVFELIRGKCNRIQALPNELTLLMNNLTSGYHRDMQLTKESLFPALLELNACLDILVLMLENIVIKENIIEDEKYQNIFTVEAVNNLVLSGVPFRDAYKIIAEQVENKTFKADTQLNHVHEGSIGNLCTNEVKMNFEKKIKQILK